MNVILTGVCRACGDSKQGPQQTAGRSRPHSGACRQLGSSSPGAQSCPSPLWSGGKVRLRPYSMETHLHTQKSRSSCFICKKWVLSCVCSHFRSWGVNELPPAQHPLCSGPQAVKSPSPCIQATARLHFPMHHLPPPSPAQADRLHCLWELGILHVWEGVPDRSVPELQAAGTTQWSVPKREQPLGPNNSKLRPRRPFRLSHITQPQNK